MDLANVLTKAKRLVDASSSPEFDKYAKKLHEGGYMDMQDVPMSPTPYPMDGQMVQSRPIGNVNAPIDASTINRKTKLPKAIIESIMNNPLVVEDPEEVRMRDFTNRLVEKVNPGGNQSKPKFSEVLNESAGQGNQAQQQQAASSNGTVDYSLIKTIVEETVRKYMGALQKKLMTEGKETGNGSGRSASLMTIGKNIRFMDDDGNLYEAQLKYIKNVKKKK